MMSTLTEETTAICLASIITRKHTKTIIAIENEQGLVNKTPRRRRGPEFRDDQHLILRVTNWE
jgi:hypothetical protein